MAVLINQEMSVFLQVSFVICSLGNSHTAAAGATLDSVAEGIDRLGPHCRALINQRMRQDPPTPTHLNELFWVHVPKTGTSFGATVWKYACPAIPADVFTPEGQKQLQATGMSDFRLGVTMHFFEKYKDLCPSNAFATARRWEQAKTSAVKGHTALPKPLAESRRGLLMLRQPVKRLCSAFQFKHTVGMAPADRQRLLATVTTPKEFARFPGVSSCATKMITQSNCAQNVNVSVEMASLAQERLVRAFAFVGITDYWNHSMCLFHAQLGGAPQSFAFDNNRPSQQWQSAEARQMAIARIRGCREVANDDDAHDMALYNAALTLFAKRLCTYGLVVPESLRHLLSGDSERLCPQPT